jgi:hypothetical protein
MAVVRTVLPRKGIIQPRHGDNYETDLDTNWLTIDSLLQDAADVQTAVTAAGTVEAWLQDRGISGVVSGFNLGGSAGLTPALSAGVLYAQGKRYAPVGAPNPGAAPASQTSYLFRNSTSGFYYQASAVGATSGDALIGKVTTNATQVTDVEQGTRLYGFVSVAPADAGNFTVPHLLGRPPSGAMTLMTSGGAIWFQSTMYDGTNLYLVASASGVTAKVQLW